MLRVVFRRGDSRGRTLRLQSGQYRRDYHVFLEIDVMRLLFGLAFTAVVGVAQLAYAQQSSLFPTIGPSFKESAVSADRFDAVFNVPVTTFPAVALLLGQTADARFDAVVCNVSGEVPGWVKADPAARWGVLDPGQCTMFANFADLQLTTAGSQMEWTVKVFLRSHR
ncbi:MAG: hypothetical protein Q8R82_07415 [Hyphomonadaceae bacterium]|nr:hypothetical protein [Hyphomonadaceae bacterium]